MPAKTFHGNQLTALLEVCDGHQFTRDANGNDELQIRYVCKWELRNTLLPDIGSAATAAGYSNLFLAQVNMSRDEAGQAEINLTYRGSLVTFQGLPAASYQLLGAGQEVPINQHPQFKGDLYSRGSWSTSEGKFSDTGTLNGIESFLAPGATFVETTYSFSAPSEGDLAGIGKINTPSNLRNARPGYWLLTGSTGVNQGSFYQYQKTWQYSPTGWRVDLDGYHVIV